MNKVIFRTNKQNVSEHNINHLNQRVNFGRDENGRKLSLFQVCMEQQGITIKDHADWFDGGDGYWMFAFRTENSMRLMNCIKGFLKTFLKDERIHIYIQNDRKEQYYQLVPKDYEFAELECGYSFKRKPRHYDKLKQDLKNMEEYFNHPDFDTMKEIDGHQIPLFHNKIIRKKTLADECFGYGCDKNNPPVIHAREVDIRFENKQNLKQYSLFVNHLNYKKTLLVDSKKIFDVITEWHPDDLVPRFS